MLPPFISQILDFIYWTILMFIYTENQQANPSPIGNIEQAQFLVLEHIK